MTEKLLKRLYIGGLTENCSEKDLSKRFESFGNILTIDIPQNNTNGKTKGFGYISLKISDQSYKKCLSTLNNTKWRGKELKIEEAKADYMQRLRDEWKTEIDKKENKISKRKVKRREFIREADDLTPITDETAKDRKGWVIGKFGRAMSILKIKNPRTKQMFKYDPTKYNNSLKKFNISYTNIPINKLTLNPDKNDTKKNNDIKYNSTINNSGNNNLNENEKDEKLKQTSILNEKKKELANQRRLESLKEKQERNKLAKQQIKKALINIDSREKNESHIKFDEFDDEENDNENEENNESIKKNESKSTGNELTLFDSDEEEEEDDEIEKAFEVKKVFEGKAGEERFKLQKSFNGDSRFKLGDEFIDDNEDDEDNEGEDYINDMKNKEAIEDQVLDEDEMIKELAKDHEQTMDVLNMLFGDNEKKNNQLDIKKEKNLTESSENLTINKPNQLMWNDTVRFDPDNEEAEKYIINNESESKKIEESVHEDNEENVKKVETSIQAPVVSKDKYFEVTKNLSSILLGESKNKETGFSIFGFRNEEENNNNKSFLFGFNNTPNKENNNTSSFSFSFNKTNSEENENDNSKDITKNLSTSKLFFFHLKEKDLKHRSLYSDTNRVFMRKETISEITEAFESKRQELTQEFKRKHKSAFRKKIKMQRLNNNKRKEKVHMQI